MKQRLYMSMSLCSVLLLSACATSIRHDHFFIHGEVIKPDRYDYCPGMQLRDAVYMAEGLTSFSSDKVIIKRQGNELTYFIVPVQEKTEISFARKRADSVNPENPALEPNDVVEIRRGCLSQEIINWTRKKSNQRLHSITASGSSE